MARLKEPDDVQLKTLLQRIERRDENALTELHQLFSRRIFAFALHRLSDAHDAETVVADTLFEVWKNPGRFRGESKVSTWVLGIAHFKILNTVRARGAAHECIDDYAEVFESPEHTPMMHMELRQQRDAVIGCMEKLTAPHRECMQLVFYEGLSLAEVAQVQSVPENTVKTRLFHARKNLKTCLQRI
ncbi:MAG TPA: sigma-70 family RNA polymerase sigma factor [Noviherbaspirillum sp.]|uniref:RNA polymerase sigma factor n=1 Tax=Noviherbaspirillum sp. TaxID=1926288 RepID=UPI002D6C0BF7|nr:sigma-70 family RNA polymerase sigma factor [Noviherbaspirillum sp.]HYD97511.1 sigma-70 family RNA polymerase sigma factor [Noviherbaspirillum sp.]